MEKSEKISLLVVTLITGLLIVLGISDKKEQPLSLSPNPSTTEVQNYIKESIRRHIKKHLNQGDIYTELEWKTDSYTDDSDNITVIGGSQSDYFPPISKWNSLGISHTFIITNEKGCESHYCKSIKIDKQGNITNFTNKVSGGDYTGIGLITGMEQGPLRDSNNRELIIWGEDIIRNYIDKNKDISQMYKPIKWILYTKLTLDKREFKALDIEFTPIKPINQFHPNWKYAALCIKHEYSIEGKDGYKQTKNSVFIISPKGKVKEISSYDFSLNKSAKEIYTLLFTGFY